MNAITPSQFKEAYGSGIPALVIETVNKLLLEDSSYEGKTVIRLSQPRVVAALVEAGIARQAIFDRGYLDFEPEFRKAGWKVTWNKGAYYEDENASHWIFEF